MHCKSTNYIALGTQHHGRWCKRRNPDWRSKHILDTWNGDIRNLMGLATKFHGARAKASSARIKSPRRSFVDMSVLRSHSCRGHYSPAEQSRRQMQKIELLLPLWIQCAQSTRCSIKPTQIQMQYQQHWILLKYQHQHQPHTGKYDSRKLRQEERSVDCTMLFTIYLPNYALQQKPSVLVHKARLMFGVKRIVSHLWRQMERQRAPH